MNVAIELYLIQPGSRVLGVCESRGAQQRANLALPGRAGLCHCRRHSGGCECLTFFFLSAAACYLFIKYLRKFSLIVTDCYCSSIPLFPTQGSCHLYRVQINLFIGEIKLVLVEMPF